MLSLRDIISCFNCFSSSTARRQGASARRPGIRLGLLIWDVDVIGCFKAPGFVDVGVHEFIAGSLSRIAGTKAK